MPARYKWTCELCLTTALCLVALSGCRELFPYPAAADQGDAVAHGDAAAPVDTRSADRGSTVDSLDPTADRLIDVPVALPDLARCEEDSECQWPGCPDCRCCGGVCVEGSAPCSGCMNCGPDDLCCGSECIDPTARPDHCGGCGIDCEGGECIDSQCQPVLLLEANYLSDIAMYGDQIYVFRHLSPSQVISLSKRATSEPATTPAIASNLTNPLSVAVDATHLCWVEQQRVACLDPNVSGSTVIWEEAATMGVHIALNSGSILWSSSTSSFTDFKLHTVSKKLGPTGILLADDLVWSRFVVDDSMVYYHGTAAGQGVIYQRSIASGTVTQLASIGSGTAGDLALFDSVLYWIDRWNGRVDAVDLGSMVTYNMVTFLTDPTLLAVDEDAVYVVEEGYRLMRFPRSGGFDQRINMLDQPDDLVRELLVDETHLVWLVYKDAQNKYQIWKMVK